MIIASMFIFNFSIFCVIIYFLTKLPTSGILFSTAVNAGFVANPLILGILPSISVILALYYVFLTDPVVSEILFSNSLSYLVYTTNPLLSILFNFSTNLSKTAFLTTSFLLHHLVYLNQQEQVLIVNMCLIDISF